MARLPRASKGKSPRYLDAGANDALMQMLFIAVQELSVTRDRVAALETVLAQNNLLPADAIDSFRPTAEWDAARSAARAQLNDRFLEVIAEGLGPKAA